MRDILLCPGCKSVLKGGIDPGRPVCAGCGFTVPFAGSIPLLIKDRAALDRLIEDARKKSADEWFEAEQLSQKKGPYRHHLKKRIERVSHIARAYLEPYRGKELLGLDLGCGDGVNTGWFSSLCDSCYASDYNLLRLQRLASPTDGLHLFLADITDYPVADNSFDIILFNHVLEHIPDDIKALREVRRVLAKKGLLILGVPNEGAFFWRLAYRLQPGILATTDHIHFYTQKKLEKLCKETGFLIEKTLRIGWGIPHWSIDSRVRRYKLFDDIFEAIGKRIFPGQSTSLYLFLVKDE